MADAAHDSKLNEKTNIQSVCSLLRARGKKMVETPILDMIHSIGSQILLASKSTTEGESCRSRVGLLVCAPLHCSRCRFGRGHHQSLLWLGMVEIAWRVVIAIMLTWAVVANGVVAIRCGGGRQSFGLSSSSLAIMMAAINIDLLGW